MTIAYFSGNGNCWIDVDAGLVSQNPTTRTSKIHWIITVNQRPGTTPIYSGVTSRNTGWADSNIGRDRDLWNVPSRSAQIKAFNFVQVKSVTIAEGFFEVPHNSDGTASYYVNAGLDLESLGVAQAGTGTRALPPLGGPPEAPTPMGFGIVTQTSAQYLFKPNGDSGSPIREMQVHYGPNPDYGYDAIISDGTTPITNLTPGETYYFWSRARNDVGWGPFSQRTSTITAPGARVKVNGSWRYAIPYVKVNGVWKLAQPYSKVNGIWRKTT